MHVTLFERFMNQAPLLTIGLIVMVLMAGAVAAGHYLRGRRAKGAGGEEKALEDMEGFVISAVLGLLALLMGFTFSLAVDRFETRRALVLEEANAIGTTYLRTQLLEPPHRQRISNLLVAYTDNRLVLAEARPDQLPILLARNDALITDLWAATASAFTTIKGMDFSSSYIDSMNNLIDLDASRKAARLVRVPSGVFMVLVIYMVVTAGTLGYVLIGKRAFATACFMLGLLTLALMLIIDIDRPTKGSVREGQGPMVMLRASMKAQPPPVFDKFLIEDAWSAQPKP